MLFVLTEKKIFIALKENHFPNKLVYFILVFPQAAGKNL